MTDPPDIPDRIGGGASPLVLTLPGGLASREALFTALSEHLRFPAYFGRNWDALYDMLADLSWLTPQVSHVWIRHAGQLSLGRDEREAYEEVLRDAVAFHAAHSTGLTLGTDLPNEVPPSS